MCTVAQDPNNPVRQTGIVNGIDTQAENNARLEEEKEEIALDIIQFILDISGIIDPSPLSDGSNALISLARGNWFDAFISTVSIIPFADIVKIGKFPRYLETIQKAIKLAKKDIRWAAELNELFLKLKKVVDVVYDWGADKLSAAASKTLKQVKKEIDDFLEAYAKEPKSIDARQDVYYNTGGSGKANGVSGKSDVSRKRDVPPPKRNEIELEPGQKGGWNKELNGKLEPNTDYKVGNKTYKTDDQGRVARVEGELTLSKHDRNTHQQGKSGKEGGIKDGLKKDDGGHLIASIFDGAGEQINYVPMDSNLNRSAWKKMENTWAEALKKDPVPVVKVSIMPVYSNSKRPNEFLVVYWIDGEKTVAYFENIKR
ncbi:MAG: hypothetical protein GQ582_13430 [Methyloprofundus sp.]|nr:hypothetical protein [Methyloprofundus sp.]